jgi:hypothetical protein
LINFVRQPALEKQSTLGYTKLACTKHVEDCDDVDCKDVFRDLMLRMAMDRDNKVETFEEIGLTDPINSQTSLIQAKKLISGLEFTKSVYPS